MAPDDGQCSSSKQRYTGHRRKCIARNGYEATINKVKQEKRKQAEAGKYFAPAARFLRSFGKRSDHTDARKQEQEFVIKNLRGKINWTDRGFEIVPRHRK